MDFDFLEEYKKLQLKTPRLSSFILNSENSDYNYNVKDLKNCYLLANAINDENCMYGRDFYGSENCTDCDHIKNCTLCYQCLNCENCYNCNYLQDSVNCNDCDYGYFLKGCRNCIGCVGLKQKNFHIFNEPYSESDYQKKLEQLKSEKILKKFETLKQTVPRMGALMIDSENSTGNGIFHSRNIFNAFDVRECQDSGYMLECKKVTDSWDVTILEYSELCYQISTSHLLHNCNFCYFCLECSDLEYCENLIACQNCFGCISLHRKQYYILNQPYKKDEYFKKVSEIKNQLKEQGLYGEMFIPPAFPREDTVVVWPTM